MTDHDRSIPTEQAQGIARDLFLRDENTYGCAETTLVALQQLFDLPNADDSSTAMALNGGIAYSGGMCGAISGAAMAVGRLASGRIPDHKEAKRTARHVVQGLIKEFEKEYGSHNCRDLISYDIATPGGHDDFIASGQWRERCMAQIEFAIGRLHQLANADEWQKAILSIKTTPSDIPDAGPATEHHQTSPTQET